MTDAYDCTVTVHGMQNLDAEHLYAALLLVPRHRPRTADVYIEPRKPDGWLEYIVRLEYQNGGGMTIGVIQRNINERVEYHS